MSDKPGNTIVIEALPARTAEEISVLRMLAYFDIFDYPLTKNEIRQFLPEFLSETRIDSLLKFMLGRNAVYLHNDFYSLHNSPVLACKRMEGNLRAKKLLPRAHAIGRFLCRFPYVRAISISGSLSKDFADEKADIDFFIITKANRLWIARTMMHLFKKLTFITGHQHYFCMNYYVDEEALLIREQNMFTAIEIRTLRPVVGQPFNQRFLEMNSWACNYFRSGDPMQSKNEISTDGKPWYKTFVEWIFNNKAGDYLDEWLLRVTTRRWQRKHDNGKQNKNGRTMNLVTGRHFCRSNPGAFQEKVLALYKQKLRDLNLS